MAEYVEIKHVENELHIVIKNSEARRDEVQQENTRLREEIRNLQSQVRQLTQSSEGAESYAESRPYPPRIPRRAAIAPVPRL